MDDIAIDKVFQMRGIDTPRELEFFAVYDRKAQVYVSERTDSDEDRIFAHVALYHTLRYLSDIIFANVEIVLQTG
jgi:hypothetical protein